MRRASSVVRCGCAVLAAWVGTSLAPAAPLPDRASLVPAQGWFDAFSRSSALTPGRPTLLAAGGPALARTDAPGLRTPDFLSSYLGPRLAARLDGLRPRILAARLEGSPFDYTTVETLSSEARSGSARGAEAALRGWLLERTALDRLALEFGRSGGRTPSAGVPSGARIGFGFSGILPRVDVVCPTAAGDVRVRVAARGEVSMDMQTHGARAVYIGASADPFRDRYGMSLAGRF